MRQVSNPPNPWDSVQAEWLGEPPEARLEVYEEEAREILAENDSPDVGFRFSLNPYRGCFHACAYCLEGSTPILMSDGRTKPISQIRAGDRVYGTVRVGRYRRYLRTPVLQHWSRIEQAYRVRLEDGTELVASADHRFLTNRGWKHVAQRALRGSQRPHLTVCNLLLGTGHFADQPEDTTEYRSGYLCGLVRGDALLASYAYDGRRRPVDRQYQFRLAMVDAEALDRARKYLDGLDVTTRTFLFQAAAGVRRPLNAIRTHARVSVERIVEIVSWRTSPAAEWDRGFLAGIFDAEGSYSRGILRITNTDGQIIRRIVEALRQFEFDFIVETRFREKPMHVVRVRGGLREHLRFFHLTDPAITRKRAIAGQAVKNDSRLRVMSIEPLGVALRLYDITTGSGDFIANGVVSHNCYARSSHEYLGFGAGTDFDTKIVVKVNAPDRLREALSSPRWKGDTIAFSGNTDCYQPLEAVYRLTRRCLEVCREFVNPVGLITKSALIRRDLDLLSAMARETKVSVALSIPFSDDAMARAIEPNTSSPTQRFETLRMFSEAGIPTTVAVAPVIPGLNDSQISEILERARFAGASRAFLLPVRLSGHTLPVFRERLAQAYPDRAARVWSAIAQIRGGKWNETRFGDRMRGVGPRWSAIAALFEAQCRRLGFGAEEPEESPRSRFGAPRQPSLFDLDPEPDSED